MRWSCVPLTVFPCSISLLLLLLFSLSLCVSRVDICFDGFALGHSRVEARFWGGIFGEGTTTREILLRSFGSCRYGQATARRANEEESVISLVFGLIWLVGKSLLRHLHSGDSGPGEAPPHHVCGPRQLSGALGGGPAMSWEVDGLMRLPAVNTQGRWPSGHWCLDSQHCASIIHRSLSVWLVHIRWRRGTGSCEHVDERWNQPKHMVAFNLTVSRDNLLRCIDAW
ncbi:hypothetical protein CGRA01v4_09432 [Colletotrichum graminicola]|nr:hypothetical protein CGRA01v4_09432 [Colletotrichum graminicola]